MTNVIPIRRNRRSPRRRGWSNRRSTYIDPVAVAAAVRGDLYGELTNAERGEAIRLLIGRGLHAWQIADRLGICVRTVERWKARHRSTGRQEAA